MHISNDRTGGRDAAPDWHTDSAAAAGDLERGLPLHSGRALTWLSATQAVIQISGLFFIVIACLR